MKKIMLVAMMLVAMLSFAQEKKFGLDAGLELAMPMGDAADWTNFGAGLTVKGIYPMNEQIDLTGKIGYIWWAPGEVEFEYDANNYSTWTFNYYHIPILFGGKYKFNGGFYGMAELGITMMGGSVEQEGKYLGIAYSEEVDIDSESEFGFAIGGGYQMDKLDFSVTYNSFSDWNHIGLRVGYLFM